MSAKYPEESVTVNIAMSPDLAVVQGAAHFASLQEYNPAPRKGFMRSSRTLEQYPAAPSFEKITSALSYGIISSDVRLSSLTVDPKPGLLFFSAR